MGRKLVVCGAVVAIGCSSFGPGKVTPASTVEDPDAGTAADAGERDAGVDPDADAAPPETYDHLFADGDFDDPPLGTGCGTGWSAFLGTNEASGDEAHRGAKSCKVCPNGNGVTLNAPHFVPATEGDMLRVRMWVRTTGPQPSQAIITGRSWDGADSDNGATRHQAFDLDRETWDLLSFDYEVGPLDEGWYVDAYVDFEDLPEGTCVFVDDWEMWKVN